MTNYRVFKFLAGCGLATLLLAGCGSDEGPGLSKISTAPEAEAATASVVNVMNGTFDVGVDAPAFKSPRVAILLAQNHADRLKARKANAPLHAAKVKSLALPVVPRTEDCEISGTVTITADSGVRWSGTYDYAETADQCVNNWGMGGTVEINGYLAEKEVTDANGFVTETYKAGNMNGTANVANDRSYTYSSGYVEVEDDNSKDTWYEGDGSYTNKAYSGFTHGQYTITEGTTLAATMTANLAWHGTESYNSVTWISNEEYAHSGSMKMSVVDGTDTAAIDMSMNMTGTYVEDNDAEFDLDSPNGTVTINFTSPDTRDDCDAASGTYKLETVTAIKTFWSDNYPVSGELLINNNTAAVFSGPGDVTITRDGETVADYDGAIDDLLFDQSTVCSLVAGMPR